MDDTKRAATSVLDDLRDRISLAAFQMTRTEALQKGICIACKKKPILRNPAQVREYENSALCEPCFYAIAPPDDQNQLIASEVTRLLREQNARRVTKQSGGGEESMGAVMGRDYYPPNDQNR